MSSLHAVLFTPADLNDKAAWDQYNAEAQRRGYYVNDHVFMGKAAADIFAAYADSEGEAYRREVFETLHLDPGGLVWTKSPKKTAVIEGCELTWLLCHTDVLLSCLASTYSPPEYPLEGYKRLTMMAGWVLGLPVVAADELVAHLEAALPEADLAAAARYAEAESSPHFLPRPRHRNLQTKH